MILSFVHFLLCAAFTRAIENLALGRPAWQQNVIPNQSTTWGAAKAVDGKYSDRSSAGNQCTISASGYNTATWRVDLQRVVSISHINIYYRTDNFPSPSGYVSRFAGFFLYVSKTTSREDGRLCFHELQNVSGTPTEDQRINCSVYGRYVIYYNERRPDVTYPSYYSEDAFNELCEVEVYGCPVPGYYGENCSQLCSENCQGQQCDAVTGNCVNGCTPTYEGPHCSYALKRPSWQQYNSPIQPSAWGAAKAVDGEYSDRSAGGNQCSISDGRQTATWWVDLGSIVSISHIHIYYRTGNAPSPGSFYNRFAGFFVYVSNDASKDNGSLCFHELQTVDGTPIENQTISCPLHGRYVIYYNERRPDMTYPSYYSQYAYNELCEFEVYGCPGSKYYGKYCDQLCPEMCLDQRCNISSGNCLECIPGYKGPRCSQKCDGGMYGAACSQTCGHCLGNKQCHHVNGTCLEGCSAGYERPLCSKKCDGGMYGAACSQTCGHCLGNKQCHHVNGTCLEGCSAGYERPLCSKICDGGMYGAVCNQTCGHCLGNTQCHHVNGTCLEGCSDGYEGSLCIKRCDDGKFGLNCKKICGHCLDGASCNHINGTCLNGCSPGYKGSMCMSECDGGVFGLKCSQSCGQCRDGSQCHHINGTCLDGCSPGYRGSLCINECDSGMYGVNCNLRCGNCLDNTQCHHINGTCLQGCSTGYKGYFCIEECDSGRFGDECSQKCGHCLNDTECHHINGTCLEGCSTGYKGSLCINECDGGMHGVKCNQKCGHCLNDAQCHHISGACLQGCSPGYKGMFCTTECDNGRYGFNCEQSCGHCLNNTQCHHINGTCLAGCDAGYRGLLCTEECGVGLYGYNCDQTCGHCIDDTNCHHVNGSCLKGCSPGYEGSLCIKICERSYWGLNCKQSCRTDCVSKTCHHESGSCLTSGKMSETCNNDHTYIIISVVVSLFIVSSGCFLNYIIWKRNQYKATKVKRLGQKDQLNEGTKVTSPYAELGDIDKNATYDELHLYANREEKI